MKNSLTGFNSRLKMAELPVNLKTDQEELIYLANREKKNIERKKKCPTDLWENIETYNTRPRTRWKNIHEK